MSTARCTVVTVTIPYTLALVTLDQNEILQAFKQIQNTNPRYDYANPAASDGKIRYTCIAHGAENCVHHAHKINTRHIHSHGDQGASLDELTDSVGIFWTSSPTFCDNCIDASDQF